MIDADLLWRYSLPGSIQYYCEQAHPGRSALEYAGTMTTEVATKAVVEEAALAVSGMDCASCVSHVESAMKAVPGGAGRHEAGDAAALGRAGQQHGGDPVRGQGVLRQRPQGDAPQHDQHGHADRHGRERGVRL